jgi:diacylglycerol O-acyltransferase / wax synthase
MRMSRFAGIAPRLPAYQRQDGREPGVVDRASAADMTQLASDVGPVPMQIGACLVLDSRPGIDVAAMQRCIAERIRTVPRLRQRLVRTPPGCGRPIWVDDPTFDVRHHVRHQRCPAPGDEQALLGLVADVVSEPLPMSRPLWVAVLVTGLAGRSGCLIMVLHHVLADGIGGLAVLANLADGGPGMPTGPAQDYPAPAPSRRRLAADAWAARLRGLRDLPGAARTMRQSAAELGGARVRAARSSLNQPTSPRRRIAVITASLASVHGLARRHGGTVNDVMLTVITGALHRLLESRGEALPAVAVSVPISARRSATAGHLGNQVGVLPVALPTGGGFGERLDQITAIMRARKGPAPGASAILLDAAFRLLAGLGLFRWFINHQHLIHTFMTNVRGPSERMSLCGATISAVIPVTLTTGNVTVSFAVLSYAGTISLTVIADAGHLSDLDILTSALRLELSDHLVGGAAG